MRRLPGGASGTQRGSNKRQRVYKCSGLPMEQPARVIELDSFDDSASALDAFEPELPAITATRPAAIAAPPPAAITTRAPAVLAASMPVPEAVVRPPEVIKIDRVPVRSAGVHVARLPLVPDWAAAIAAMALVGTCGWFLAGWVSGGGVDLPPLPPSVGLAALPKVLEPPGLIGGTGKPRVGTPSASNSLDASRTVRAALRPLPPSAIALQPSVADASVARQAIETVPLEQPPTRAESASPSSGPGAAVEGNAASSFQPVALQGSGLTPVGRSLTYGQDDADVSPPMATSRRTLGTSRLDDLTIVIVINPDGTVDSVRAEHALQGMGDTMLLTAALSAVKSWQFRPATKSGTPVRYRAVVPLRALTSSSP